MKKIILIFAQMLFFILTAQSQHLLLAPTIEKTVAGNQYGSLLMYESKIKWSFGGFYQTSWQQTLEGMQAVNQFYGIAVNAPLVKSDKINFYFNTRCGLVNQFFVVVAPGLETELKISKIMSIATLMSVRMSYPSAALRVYIKI